MTEVPSSDPRRERRGDRRREVVSSLALLAGIVAAGFAAQAVGLDTRSLPIAIVVVAVGVFLGVGLRKALLRR